MYSKILSLFAFIFLLFSCGTKTNETPLIATFKSSDPQDPYLWLEEDSQRTHDFILQHNKIVEKRLQQDKRFPSILAQIESLNATILPALTTIGSDITRVGRWILNFDKNKQRPHGVWRRMLREKFMTQTEKWKQSPDWEELIDFDALRKKEGKSWSFRKKKCFYPDVSRCLIFLSNGGKDSNEIREFDLETKSFIEDGFHLSEGKHQVTWLNANTLLVGLGDSKALLNKGGGPREVRLWKRDTSISQAPVIFTSGENEASFELSYLQLSPKNTIGLIKQNISRYKSKVWKVLPNTRLEALDIPKDAHIYDESYKGFVLFSLRSSWKKNGKVFAENSLLSTDASNEKKSNPELIFEPKKGIALQSVHPTKDFIVISALKNASLEIIIAYKNEKNVWINQTINTPGSMKNGKVFATSAYSDNEFFLSIESFIKPGIIYSTAIAKRENKIFFDTVPFLSDRPAFPEKNYTVEQFFAQSADSTPVSYFVVHKNNIKLDGTNPTILEGYGGFGNVTSTTPSYIGQIGAIWLENGGVYACANIRGGGEFGPKWHTTALRENRQKSFDDFIAVAEDLQKRKITSPQKLGILGASNGGLLVATVMIQRPELFGAVLSIVPILDMLRYNKLLYGHQWLEEYGNPDDSSSVEGKALRKYSPYQNVVASKKYPPLFLLTNESDDRLHPGHGRKMAAKMESQGHSVLLLENKEGGHLGSDLTSIFLEDSLYWIFWFQELMDKKS